jgi:hypothetical protein
VDTLEELGLLTQVTRLLADEPAGRDLCVLLDGGGLPPGDGWVLVQEVTDDAVTLRACELGDLGRADVVHATQIIDPLRADSGPNSTGCALVRGKHGTAHSYMLK